ncbi:MerR family transcriptional regulator [Alloyangia pacifica]|uniref:MerR family transcriptional regulator n=1 Tax=Alloyangia pacifica TaxID=311180 RepID=UPI001CFE9DDF|nr:MerR family transcriptional regulator [Alloyangia pacifica]
MSKSRDAFRTISEVAELLDTPAHVLRFWETKFSQVKPVKRAGGRRYYRPNDVALLAGIRQLLHDDGLTIKGVQKVLREQGVKHVAGIAPPAELLEDGNVSDQRPVDAAAIPADDYMASTAMVEDTEPEPQESATVLPFTQAATTPQPEARPVAAESAPVPTDGEDETPVLTAATALFPEIEDPAPHAPEQGALWDEDPQSTAAPAEEAASEPPAPSELPEFITESLEERATDNHAAPADLPELPDLSTLPRPAPGALARLATLGSIDAARAAELAPHVAALRDFLAARQGARLTRG